jgi:hypothetical protein
MVMPTSRICNVLGSTLLGIVLAVSSGVRAQQAQTPAYVIVERTQTTGSESIQEEYGIDDSGQRASGLRRRASRALADESTAIDARSPGLARRLTRRD